MALVVAERRHFTRRHDGACGCDATEFVAVTRRRMWWRRVGDRGGGASVIVEAVRCRLWRPARRPFPRRHDGACGGDETALAAATRRRLRRRRDGAYGRDAMTTAVQWLRNDGDDYGNNGGGGRWGLTGTVGGRLTETDGGGPLQPTAVWTCGDRRRRGNDGGNQRPRRRQRRHRHTLAGIVDIERAGLPLPSSSSAMAAAPFMTALQTFFGAGDGQRWRHGFCNHDGYCHDPI